MRNVASHQNGNATTMSIESIVTVNTVLVDIEFRSCVQECLLKCDDVWFVLFDRAFELQLSSGRINATDVPVEHYESVYENRIIVSMARRACSSRDVAVMMYWLDSIMMRQTSCHGRRLPCVVDGCGCACVCGLLGFPRTASAYDTLLVTLLRSSERVRTMFGV